MNGGVKDSTIAQGKEEMNCIRIVRTVSYKRWQAGLPGRNFGQSCWCQLSFSMYAYLTAIVNNMNPLFGTSSVTGTTGSTGGGHF